MPRSRTTADAAGVQARLDAAAAAVRREAEGAEGDPFDDAMVAAVTGLTEAMRAEAGALAEAEGRLGRVERRR